MSSEDLQQQLDAANRAREELKQNARTAIDAGEELIRILRQERDDEKARAEAAEAKLAHFPELPTDRQLCLLSQVFNQYHNFGSNDSWDINEFLKSLIRLRRMQDKALAQIDAPQTTRRRRTPQGHRGLGTF